ncbi:MAG: hypothetical protein EBT92_16195 [Planctomycetes bacterium]|nr:hypothetical protein [Planctomycetota bacterium]
MKIVCRLTENGKRNKVYFEINSIEELEKLLKNPPFVQDRRYKVLDFLKFHEDDVDYINSIIHTDQIFNRNDLFVKFLHKIFKYKTKNTVGYWRCRGHEDSTISNRIFEHQSKLGKLSSSSRFTNPDYKKSMTNCIEYWLNRGFSPEESLSRLKERQSTFSLEKCIKKHGIEVGTALFSERQKKWIRSLYHGKSDESIIEMNKKKFSNKFGKASGSSLKVFLPLVEKLKSSTIISDSECFFGHGENREFYLYDRYSKSMYFYDFTIPKLKVIVEFNGETWHPRKEDVSWKPISCVNKTRDELIDKEDRKDLLAKEFGFSILKLWDSTSESDNVELAFDFIKNRYLEENSIDL